MWIGVAPHPLLVAGTAAHRDDVLLGALESLPVPDLALTHVDRTETVAATAMSAYWESSVDVGVAVSLLAAQLDGAAVCLGSDAAPAGEPRLAGLARRAALAGSAGREGRAIHYDGHDRLGTSMSAAELVAKSAIDEVVGVGVAVPPAGMVELDGYARPIRRDTRLMLLVEPAAAGTFRPVEIRSPHECCGGTH